MPTYNYGCSNCESSYDFVQSIHDSALTRCELCGSEDVRRLPTVPLHIQVDSCRTVGTWMEKNSRVEKNRFTDERAAREEEKERQLDELEAKQPAGRRVIRKKGKDKPWWRSGAVPGIPSSDKPLDTAKISNIQRFIETGV